MDHQSNTYIGKYFKWTIKPITEWPNKLYLEWTTRFQSYKWHLPLITWSVFLPINPLWISHNYLTDHQISREIECHPSTVLAIEHQLIASPQLEIDNLELDFIHKLKKYHWNGSSSLLLNGTPSFIYNGLPDFKVINDIYH